MQVTPRDLEILSRVHGMRACDSAALGDLFPTTRALRQRLWRLTRERYLRVHRVGNHRVYSLGPLGLAVLGLPAREVRISRAAAARYLTSARVRRELQSEGYELDGQDQVGRATVIRATRDGCRTAVTICEAGAPRRSIRRLVDRLRSLVNPFGPLVDELMIFGPPHLPQVVSQLPVAYLGRITARSLPSNLPRPET